MAIIDHEKITFNENVMYAKQIDAEERHSKKITDEDAFNACMKDIELPLMKPLIEKLKESIEEGTPFSVSKALAVIEHEDREYYYGFDEKWDSNGNALVGQILKNEYPDAKMKLNLVPKGYRLLLERYPNEFTAWRKRIEEYGNLKKAETKPE